MFANVKMDWATPGDYKGCTSLASQGRALLARHSFSLLNYSPYPTTDMAIMLGFFESAIVQLTEGSGKERTIGEFMREEAFKKLGIED